VSPLKSPLTAAVWIGAAASLKASEKKNNKLLLSGFKSCYFTARHAYGPAVGAGSLTTTVQGWYCFIQTSSMEICWEFLGCGPLPGTVLGPTAACVRWRVMRGHKAMHQLPDKHIYYRKRGGDLERQEKKTELCEWFNLADWTIKSKKIPTFPKTGGETTQKCKRENRNCLSVAWDTCTEQSP